MKWLPGILLFALWTPHLMADQRLVIWDPLNDEPPAGLDKRWRLITDGVMGGASSGTLANDSLDGRPCVRLRGDISLKNNGGFIQLALDIDTLQAANASAYRGLMLETYGNNETYGLHLRTKDVWLPWQSYRASFTAPAGWQTIKLPFDTFEGYRIGKPLDLTGLKRIGIVAIGREFSADICVGRLTLYRDDL